MTENAIVERKPSYSSVGMSQGAAGATSMVPQTFGEVVAFASVMARAGLALPKHLRDNEGACMAVAMQAFEWGMSPFAVANKTYFVNDRMAYEAQLVSAVVNMRAGIVGRPRYTYEGEGTSRRCTVECTMADGAILSYQSPMISQIKVKNSPLWTADPDQQLGYFSIRSWARRHTPEVILGVYDRDEIAEAPPMNVTPKANTGLSERLAARAGPATEGFNAVRTASEVTIDAETGEVMETVTTTAPQEAEDAHFEDQAGDVAETQQEPSPPDPEPPATDYDLGYLEDWSGRMLAEFQRMKSSEEIKAIWDGPDMQERFEAFKRADVNKARDFYNAVMQHRKALAAK
jgi:hypothetical protein